MGQAPLQLGWIPYWNLLPLQHELTRLSGGQLKLMSGHPSVVSRWLMDGTVHVAPASSIALFKSRQLEMALPYGIASDGPVLSVYIGMQREHEEFLDFIRTRQNVLREHIRCAQAMHADDERKMTGLVWSLVKSDRPKIALPTLQLTSASAASAALTRVLMNLWLGEESAQHLMARSANHQHDSLSREMGVRSIELVIGDEALQRRHEFWKILDLGQIWHELTGMPFVFGLWQTSAQTLPSSMKSLISEAASIAQARMRVEPQIYFPSNIPTTGDGQPVDLAAYWKVIQYKLSERHLRSLLMYFAFYQQICSRQDDESVAERFLRWNRVWTGSQSIAFQ